MDKSPGGTSRVKNAKWEHVGRGGKLSENGAVLTCATVLEEGAYAAVAGPLISASGITEFSLAILKSESNTGGAMLLGVVEDTGLQGNLGRGSNAGGSVGWGRAFGLAPWNGRFFGFPQADTRDPSRAGEIRGDALMTGDCRGSAEGTSVRVRVDATQRRLYFCINDASEWVLARENGKPIVLPEGVQLRPFARCGTQYDMVALNSAIRHTVVDLVSAASTPSSSVHVSPVAVRPPPPVMKRPPEPKPPPTPSNSKREAELSAQVLNLRTELDMTRAQLDKERMLRIKAEQAQQVAERRAEEAMKMRRRMSVEYTEPTPTFADPLSAKEIEASLLREVLVNGGGAEAAGGSTFDQERARQRAIRDRALSVAPPSAGAPPPRHSRRTSAALDVLAFGAGIQPGPAEYQ